MYVSISAGRAWLHCGIQNYRFWVRLLVSATCGWDYRQAINTLKLLGAGAIDKL